jgi:hypothetical protein
MVPLSPSLDVHLRLRYVICCAYCEFAAILSDFGVDGRVGVIGDSTLDR